ncbi:MAG: glycosyltransferase family 39 protein [Nitrospirae bacterium]|nr:glycosyltransferase family 39 protein [Nitrospirota bacterium]
MGLLLEPRIIENISVFGYRITGGEHLWIPRALSSVFWVVGGFFLYLMARAILSPGSALFSIVFYLFLPYGILASRSIQPDPLMIMMMLISIYRILKYDENPSQINLIAAAIVTAIAMIVKPYCFFMIFGAFFSLAVLKKGFWKAIFQRDTLIFTLIIIMPTVSYYVYGLLSNVGFIGEHARGSFLPHLVLSPSFWSGWLSMIRDVMGYIAFFLAIIGLFIIKRGRPKALLLGLWIGYFLFGLSATFQIHTHNYYTMPFIPIVAISLVPVFEMTMNRHTALLSARLKIFVLIFVLFITLLGLSLSKVKLPLKNGLSEYKNELKTAAAFIGINPEFGKFVSDDFEKRIEISQEIGERVGHSSSTIFLDPYFGRVIAYYGEFSGLPWPTSESLYERRLRGTKVPDIKEDFTSENITILYQGKFIKYSSDFFIITAFDEFDRQADLKDFLKSHFPVFAQSDEYLIFDLRKMHK